MRGRGDVINHVADLYGRDSVCRFITLGHYGAKAAIKMSDGPRIALCGSRADCKANPSTVRGRYVSIGKALEQVPELRKAVKVTSR